MDVEFLRELRAAKDEVLKANERLMFLYCAAEVFGSLSSAWKNNPLWKQVELSGFDRVMLYHPSVIYWVIDLAKRHGFKVSFDEKELKYTMTTMEQL
jgi:hypothetical protein